MCSSLKCKKPSRGHFALDLRKYLEFSFEKKIEHTPCRTAKKNVFKTLSHDKLFEVMICPTNIWKFAVKKNELAPSSLQLRPGSLPLNVQILVQFQIQISLFFLVLSNQPPEPVDTPLIIKVNHNYLFY